MIYLSFHSKEDLYLMDEDVAFYEKAIASEGGIVVLFVSVPVHCLPFTF